MKSVITTICVIIPLVILFVIIDRKDFHSGNDVAVLKETMMGRESTTMTTLKSDEKSMKSPKPTDVRPVAEIMPVVKTKPVAESKPVGNKPVNENRTSEPNMAEIKPVGIKLSEIGLGDALKITDVKPFAEEKVAPVAIPVVTAEDAERLNSFAVFLSSVKTTIVEGEIVERSELPDPQKSDYPDCRYTAHFSGNAIQNGESCPREILLIIEGFYNFKTMETDKINNGDKVVCKIIPFEYLPVEAQSTQQADDLNMFLLERYYVLSIKTIDSYVDNTSMPKSGIYFSDGNEDYISIFARQINPPIQKEVDDAQKKTIKNDLEKMNNLLHEYNENRIRQINNEFSELWEKEKQKDQLGHNRVTLGNITYVWRNINNSFWCLPTKYSLLSNPRSLSQETLDAFAALKKACEANGVQLIVSLVPNGYVISSRIINPSFRDIPDLQTATYVKQLAEIGVESLYASDALIHDYNRYSFAYIYPNDLHPSDTTQDVLTDCLTKRLQRYSFEPELDPIFSERFIHAYAQLAVYPTDCDIGNNKAGEEYLYRRIVYGGKHVPKNAQVMVIGNSFANLPIDNAPASLLQYKTRIRVDTYKLAGFGPFSEIMIQLLSRPEFFLKDKKVLIMQVGTEHLQTVNNLNIMLNIEHADGDMLLLNKKKKIKNILFDSF